MTVFAFAPFGFALLGFGTLAALFLLWQDAPGWRAAAWLGFWFGVGLFGAGASWVYVALTTFGGMPRAVAVLGTAGFIAYLALWPALAGAVAVRFTKPASVLRALAMAGAWPLAEWLRGTVMSGFPWLDIGSAQLPGTSLAGFAPLGGVIGVSLAVALVASLLTLVIEGLARGTWRMPAACAAGALALFVAGHVAGRIAWTTPVGEPLAVSLVQGNVAQHAKFDPAYRDRNFLLYAHLVEISRGRLIVLPESAFPVVAQDVPDDIVARIAAVAEARGGDAMIGLFTLEAPPEGEDYPLIHNSVVTVGVSPHQLYRKHHLVPFGETIPFKSVAGWFINSVLNIPLADQSPGPANAPPLNLAGQKVAVNICYEDAFGDELRSAARDATLLINVTNDAWYGRSIAAWQHDQIAAMRALETGRPLLRATNTGVTTLIGANGREIASLPWYTRGILEVRVTGRTGLTPYLQVGDWGALAVALALLLLALGLARRSTSA
jgi:apolipoprotein N-acyltransferase